MPSPTAATTSPALAADIAEPESSADASASGPIEPLDDPESHHDMAELGKQKAGETGENLEEPEEEEETLPDKEENKVEETEEKTLLGKPEPVMKTPPMPRRKKQKINISVTAVFSSYQISTE